MKEKPRKATELSESGIIRDQQHLKQINTYSKNQTDSSRFSVDNKLSKCKELINEGSLFVCVVCQRFFYKKPAFCCDENKFKPQI